MNISILLIGTDRHMIETCRRGLVTSGLNNLHSPVGPDGLKTLCESGETFDIAIIFISEECEKDFDLFSSTKKYFPDAELIVVLTNNDSDQASEYLHKGAFHCMKLPHTREVLINKIKEAVRYKIHANCKPRILIMEDDPVSAKLMHKYLEAVGSCTLVSDGLMAIEEFEKALLVDDFYHLLILDIMVPGVHGKDVLRKIREIEEREGVPKNRKSKVIMTTALGDSSNIIESFKNDCNAYLIKPIDRKSLMNEISLLGFNADITKR